MIKCSSEHIMAFRFIDLPLRRKFILIFLVVLCLGGTITVRNETGRGAVFTLQWPLPDKG